MLSVLLTQVLVSVNRFILSKIEYSDVVGVFVSHGGADCRKREIC
jgi:hypothetical protein